MFKGCKSLTRIKFTGNAPNFGGGSVFTASSPTIYRSQGTTGWGETFAGCLVRLWP